MANGVLQTDANGVLQTDANGVLQTVSSGGSSQFDVVITGTNSPVAPGNNLDVTVDVTNSGSASDTQTITLNIDSGVGQVDSKSVTVSAGQSTTGTLTWSVPSNQAAQDYTATVASADDSASQTVTVGSGATETVFDFETGDTSRWDTSPHLSASSGSPPFNSGSQIGVSDADTQGPLARVIPAQTAGGVQISEFEYYWHERQSQQGAGIRLFNSDGNVEMGFATDNPAWVVSDSGGITNVKGNNSVYNDWVRFTATFDWGAGTFDIDYKNVETGNQVTQSGFSLKQGADVEEVVLEQYHGDGGGYRDGSNVSVDIDWDDIRIKS